MEQKKYHLQKQIIEALRANDNDLYSHLKSQWAHRFGVESLEELENLDLNQLNQNTDKLINQKIDQSRENSLGDDEEIHIKDDSQEKEIQTKEFEPIQNEKKEFSKIKSYKITSKEIDKNKDLNQLKYNKDQGEIKALIPLPPKPKYGYLRKWLLRK